MLNRCAIFQPFVSVFGTAANDVFVTAGSTIFHYDGATWTAVRSTTAAPASGLTAFDHDVLISHVFDNQVQLLRRACVTCGL